MVTNQKTYNFAKRTSGIRVHVKTVPLTSANRIMEMVQRAVTVLCLQYVVKEMSTWVGISLTFRPLVLDLEIRQQVHGIRVHVKTVPLTSANRTMVMVQRAATVLCLRYVVKEILARIPV